MTIPLLHRVAAGEDAAVRELLSRYGGLVFALARRFCFEPGDIDDAVQDIFAGVWKSAGRFDAGLGSEETFVAMVARRRLIDRRRRAQRRQMKVVDGEVLGQVVADPRPASEPVSEDARRAAEHLSRLRPEQQMVLRLSICQGMSHEQISGITAMPLGTVKTHVRRGLIALRASLNAVGAGPEGDEGSEAGGGTPLTKSRAPGASKAGSAAKAGVSVAPEN
ncbi:sigma-70 family RNA polymerase sigma factor [soil metagenome]